MFDILEHIDPFFFFRGIEKSVELQFTVDAEFLDNEELCKSEFKKYALKPQEKIGIIIVGTFENSMIIYKTVLTSVRFLMYCNDKKVFDFEWSKICNIYYSGGNIEFLFCDGSSKKIRDRLFVDSSNVKKNQVNAIIDFIVLLMNEKIWQSQ